VFLGVCSTVQSICIRVARPYTSALPSATDTASDGEGAASAGVDTAMASAGTLDASSTQFTLHVFDAAVPTIRHAISVTVDMSARMTPPPSTPGPATETTGRSASASAGSAATGSGSGAVVSSGAAGDGGGGIVGIAGSVFTTSPLDGGADASLPVVVLRGLKEIASGQFELSVGQLVASGGRRVWTLTLENAATVDIPFRFVSVSDADDQWLVRFS